MLSLLLLPVLASCSGTRFGDALSRSFSAAPPADSQAAAASASPAPADATALRAGLAGRPGGTTATGTGTAASSQASGARGSKPDGSSSQAGPTVARQAPASGTATTTNTPARPPAAAPGSSAPAATIQPSRPAPYRVTILLPQADAAAPAEVVTQALRAAGVPFEVETIERLGRHSTPQAPVSRPAPEPR